MYDIQISDSKFLPHRGCHLRFQLSPGEPLVFFGENGLGKTTLLRCMRRMFNHYSSVEQHPLDFFYDRKIGVIKNIFEAQGGQLNKLRLERLWRDFSFEDRENFYISHLSGGEAQALKLCLGLSKESGVYLLDEPSQFLDGSKKEMLLYYLEKMLLEQKSIIIVEHDLSWIPKNWKILKLIELNGNIQLGQV